MKSRLLIYFLLTIVGSFLIYGFFDDLPEGSSDLDKIDPQIQQQINDMTVKAPLLLPSGIQYDNLATIPDTVCYKGPIPAYPTGVFGHASNWLGDTLYLCGGSSAGAGTVNVYRYSLLSDSWSTGVSMPEAKTGGSLVKCGEALYYIGGGTAISGTTQTASTLRYRVGIGWDVVAPILTPVVGNAAVSYGDSVIYCLLGGWTQYYRQVQVYRVATNTWSRGSDSLPAGAGRRSLAGGIVDNKIYVACGFSGAFRKDMYIGTIGADANSITWALGPAVPCRGTGMSRPGGVGIDGHFYVVGAETTPAPTRQDSIFMYNTTSGTWLSPPLSGRGTGAASNYWGSISARIIGDRVNIFIPGGSVAGATTWGLYVARSGGCSISQTSTLSLTINLEACNLTDTITVELRSSTSPYSIVESETGLGGQSIARTFSFSNAFDGTSYYIVVRHRNSIETWSKVTVTFTGGALTYDFTTAQTQAFGNNMVNVGGEWSIYTGDVTQDGVVDGADLSAIDNDAFNFVSGYVPTDLNCDSIVDGSDAAFADNNAANFVTKITP